MRVLKYKLKRVTLLCDPILLDLMSVFQNFNSLLTHFQRIDILIIIIWVCPLSFLGVLGVFFFYIFLSDFSMKFLSANRIAACDSVTSEAMLFAYVPQNDHQTYMS